MSWICPYEGAKPPRALLNSHVVNGVHLSGGATYRLCQVPYVFSLAELLLFVMSKQSFLQYLMPEPAWTDRGRRGKPLVLLTTTTNEQNKFASNRQIRILLVL